MAQDIYLREPSNIGYSQIGMELWQEKRENILPV